MTIADTDIVTTEQQVCLIVKTTNDSFIIPCQKYNISNPEIIVKIWNLANELPNNTKYDIQNSLLLNFNSYMNPLASFERGSREIISLDTKKGYAALPISGKWQYFRTKNDLNRFLRQHGVQIW